MKIRTGFVSNSSSSSFLLVFDEPILSKEKVLDLLLEEHETLPRAERVYTNELNDAADAIFKKLVPITAEDKIFELVYDAVQNEQLDVNGCKDVISSIYDVISEYYYIVGDVGRSLNVDTEAEIQKSNVSDDLLHLICNGFKYKTSNAIISLKATRDKIMADASSIYTHEILTKYPVKSNYFYSCEICDSTSYYAENYALKNNKVIRISHHQEKQCHQKQLLLNLDGLQTK